MITSKDGTVTIEGTEPQLLAETMGILEAIYQMLKANHDDDFARSRVESLGRILIMRQDGQLGAESDSTLN